MHPTKSLFIMFILVVIIIFLAFIFGPSTPPDAEQKDLRELQSVTQTLNYEVQKLEALQFQETRIKQKVENQKKKLQKLEQDVERTRNHVLEKYGVK